MTAPSSQSPITLKRYRDILKALFIVFVVRPWHDNIARSVLQAPKVYFYDTGLVEGDEGIRFENLMATALLKHVQWQHDVLGRETGLHYIRTKDDAEVRGASFFSSVDWDATARQEASPALVPSGALSESEAMQRKEALKQYLDHLPPQVVAQWRLSRDMTDTSSRPRRRWWQKRPSFLWASQ